jgi:hypothetical protein
MSLLRQRLPHLGSLRSIDTCTGNMS